ncbi:MAG TPA: hypothetical protein VMZ11_00445 [Mycobacteriales bacterium]|nr:hypothetical protein [Mycobacteriales bacterium]
MRRTLSGAGAALGVLCLLAAPALAATSRNLPGTTCPAFPATSIWHADISKLPTHARSGQWISHMSPTRTLHPDFGPSYGAQSVPYGIPITYVDASHAKVTVRFDYASESDRVGYPLGSDTKVEGGQWTSGDRHTVVVDRTACRVYETWATRRSGTSWLAGSGATWDLKSNALRPAGWTSADAAGLPVLPGLLRYDEVAAGSVDHAIRFTTNVTNRAYVWPARHQAGSVSDATYPPMGARFRLKASYPISDLRPDTKAVLWAMKKYGLVLADNGSPWYFQGTADTHWTSPMLDQLKRVPASAFVAVDVSSLRADPNSGAVRTP